MEPLDPKLARLVHEGMVEAVPGPEVEARVLEGLLARLTPAGPGGDEPPGQGATPGAEGAAAVGRAAASGKTLLWIGVLGAAAVAGVVGVSAGRNAPPEPEREPTVTAVSAPREIPASERNSAPAAAPTASAVEPEPSPAAPKLVAPATKAPRAAAHPSRPRDHAATTEPTREPDAADPDELEAEIQQIAAADRALARGDARRALQLAREHAAAHPRGQLGLERDAIELRARCELGEPGAIEAATAFLRAHGDAPAAAKVRTGCAATP